MKGRTLWMAILTLLALGVGVPSAHGFICDGGIVAKGSTRAEVRASCGDPTCTRRPKEIFTDKAGIFVPLAMDEEWIYNPGPGRFITFIRFYQGKVVDRRTGGFGWDGERDCGSIPPPR